MRASTVEAEQIDDLYLRVRACWLEDVPAVEHSVRRFAYWRLAALGALVLGMLLITDVAIAWVDAEARRLDWLTGAQVLAALATVVALGCAAFFEPLRPRTVSTWSTQVWRGASGHWPAFVVGTALALPLFALFTPVVLGDADSVRIIAAVRHVQREGAGFLADTQDNLLPHLVFGPTLDLAGIEGVRVLTIISVQVLAGVVALVTHRLSGSMWSAVTATFALLSFTPMVVRTIVVPMYPAMLALAYLGCWLAYRAISHDNGWRYTVTAGFCLVLAAEAQSVGQLFLAVPLLLLITAQRARHALVAVGRIYLTTVVVAVPRLWINLSEDGFSRISSNRTDYWINKGYVRRIQAEFWDYQGVDEDVTTYLSRLSERFVSSLGPWGWVALAFAAVAMVGLRARARLFALACITFMTVAVTVKGIPPHPRYFSPLWPGIAILAGLLVGQLRHRRFVLLRLAGMVPALVLLVVAATTFQNVANRAAELNSSIDDAPYGGLVDSITDGKGVIGSRSHVFVSVADDIPTYGGQFLTEDEYVTYLTWPSDMEVIQMLKRHDIGWVLIHARRDLETTYHDTWLRPAYGKRTRHIEGVVTSPAFCRAAEEEGYVLFHLGGCKLIDLTSDPRAEPSESGPESVLE